MLEKPQSLSTQVNRAYSSTKQQNGMDGFSLEKKDF